MELGVWADWLEVLVDGHGHDVSVRAAWKYCFEFLNLEFVRRPLLRAGGVNLRVLL